MAARCASCSYALSVSDSVSCYECLSYFHIDCAQLVGFPYYELSSEPVRNTFHCQTCKILPLPRQSDGFSDSDSDDECTMPSRQLDYHSEGQPDLAKDMNEVKSTVQDLSELCKDMFREIGELKSINLTLRCCVENLRHDSEKRDGIISELKRRIEALEGKGIVNVFKPIDTPMFVDRMHYDKDEDAERYLTPDPEYSRLKEIESLDEGSLQQEIVPPADLMPNLTQPNLECETPETENISEITTIKPVDLSETAIEILHTETSDFDGEKENETNEENVHFAEEETISTTAREDSSDTGTITSVKDWDWRGDKAIQLQKSQSYSSAEEDDENEITAIEHTESQGWKTVDEDVKSQFITKKYDDEASETSNSSEGSEEEAERKIVDWSDEVEKYDEEGEDVESSEETEEPALESDTKYLTTNFKVKIGSGSTLEGEETETTNEDVTEGAERTSLKDEEGVEKSKSEEDVEIVEGTAEVEGRVDSAEGDSRLEGDSVAEDGAAPLEEGEGGQSPEDQGEVQPSELSEDSEPPPPQPQHTPDDLWDYLKETVTGEHPATVEEFVQKLIGTLEHVPEEYIKPVIDYNIKRVTSPSFTDGEHLENKEGDEHLQGEDHGTEETVSGEAHLQENGEVALEGDHATLPVGDSSATGDGFSSEEPAALHEDTTNVPEESSASVEGYSALEAAS